MTKRAWIAFELVLVVSLVSGVVHGQAKRPPPTPTPTPPPPPAPTPIGEQMSLRGALEQAVQNNRTLINAGLDIDVADANLYATEGIQDFQVDGNLNLTDIRTTPVAGQAFAQKSLDDVH